MKNVRSFLGLDAGLVGCVRRLEINDKFYNLEAAVHGGDITAGRDIGELDDVEIWDININLFHFLFLDAIASLLSTQECPSVTISEFSFLVLNTMIL